MSCKKTKKILCWALALAMILSYGMFTYADVDDSAMAYRAAAVYHVAASGSNASGDGSAAAPWATPAYAVTQMIGGDTLLIHEGTYAGFTVTQALTGPSKSEMTVIKAAGDGEAKIDGGGSGTVLTLNNVGNLLVEGLTVKNGSVGIGYQSQQGAAYDELVTASGFSYEDPGTTGPFDNVVIKNNLVYNINGTHAISVYARNYNAPISNFVLDGNKVHFSRCGSSEAVVLNGNVDGFAVSNNLIHNNNNIGLDLIGGENTARLPSGDTGFDDRSKYDCARHGLVFNNVIFSSRTINNTAYWAEGSAGNVNGIHFSSDYDSSSGGIYVDGGQYIDIFNNLVWDNDIGIEVATEHRESDNFYVRGVKVHDNLIASTTGWVGLAFGGYSSTLGYTEQCEFTNNIFYGNGTNLGIQKSRNNKIEGNIFVGGSIGSINAAARLTTDWGYNIFYNTSGNIFTTTNMTQAMIDKQVRDLTASPLADPAAGDFSFVSGLLADSTVDTSGYAGGFGLDFGKWELPGEFFDLFGGFTDARAELLAARTFLQGNPLNMEEAYFNGNLRDYLTDQLHKAGYPNSQVLYILQTSDNSSTSGLGYMPDGSNSNGATNGIVNRMLPGNGNNAVLTKYGEVENGRAAANGNINKALYDSTFAGMASGTSRNYAYLIEIATWYGEYDYANEVAAIRMNMAKPNTYHVATTGSNTANGSESAPWATITYALTQMKGGDVLLVHAGTYSGRYTIPAGLSGTDYMRTTIKGAGDGEVVLDGGGTGTVFSMSNLANVTIEGLTIRDASAAINYSTAKDATALAAAAAAYNRELPPSGTNVSPYRNITIKDNKIYNIHGSGQSVYVMGQNYMAPVTGVVIDGNEVFGNRTHYSEAITTSGNVDGFDICNNLIYNNNNIGVDMAGFYSAARIPTATASNSNLFPDPAGTPLGNAGRDRYNSSRNGRCYNNVVFGSCVIDNDAYWEQDGGYLGTSNGPKEGEYDRCCNGLYVDGGQNIEIYNNFVFDCDIGIEVSTEQGHPNYWVGGVYVHDNILASNMGWNGQSLGGQSLDPNFDLGGVMGKTVNSRFENNILYGNAVNFNVQHTEGNTIKNNIIMGGGAAVMDWLDTFLHDANNFEANIWYNDPAYGVSDADYYKELDCIEATQLAKQVKLDAPPLADPRHGDFAVTYADKTFGTDPGSWEGTDWAGKAWKFDTSRFGIYASYRDAYDEMEAAVEYLQTCQLLDFEEIVDAGYSNLRAYLTDALHDAGFENSSVPYILKVWAPRGNRVDGWLSNSVRTNATYATDPYGIVNMMNPDAGNNLMPSNDRAAANGNINSTVLMDRFAANGHTGYKYLVMVATSFDGGKKYTQGDTRGGVNIGLNGPIAALDLSVPAVSGIEGDVCFTLSLGNALNVLGVELEFTVDGSLLASKEFLTLNGWTSVDGIAWKSLGGDTWQGSVTLACPSGSSKGFMAKDMTGIAQFVFVPRGEGEAVMKLTKASVVGLDNDSDMTTRLRHKVINDEAATQITQLIYSKYDLNKDNKVDALDLGIMLLYCGFGENSPGWSTLVKVVDSKGGSVTPSMCDVNGDGKIDMLDLLDLFIHYTK
ncbi:MAG: dockerin type I domain-containing protein [Clostridiales bacterium]|nr:dockerin type I domain-containing protein [Clostridiales bacterium]